MSSLFDAIHDRYMSGRSRKEGAGYERLTAVSLATALGDRGLIVHNVREHGKQTGLVRQLDVVVEINGEVKRILVECKEHNPKTRRPSPVDVEVVDRFHQVMVDLAADYGLIVTTTRFTRDAFKAAKAYGIQLAILRQHEAKDSATKLRDLNLEFRFRSTSIPTIELSVAQSDEPALQRALVEAGVEGDMLSARAPVYIDTNNGSAQMMKYALELRDETRLTHPEPGLVSVQEEFEQAWLRVGDATRVPLRGLHMTYELQESVQHMRMLDLRVGELVLETVGEQSSDLIIWDEDLEVISVRGPLQLGPGSASR